jgi:hypothetical protein
VAKFEKNIEDGEMFLEKDPNREDYSYAILSSLPRSGNTMTRRIFEQVTGIVTGITMPIELPLYYALFVIG